MSLSVPINVDSVHARYDIAAFIADLEPLLAAERDPRRSTEAVCQRLPRLLATPQLLAPAHRESWPDRYRSHIIAVAPSGTFTVVALVWLPGQETAIHDHIAWCCVGVLEGVECETRYHLRKDAHGDRWLQPDGDEQMAVGETCALIPPAENIHSVRNVGDTLAISLHVYGANLQTIESHSSINECFNHLPIRDDADGALIPWRSNGQSCEE